MSARLLNATVTSSQYHSESFSDEPRLSYSTAKTLLHESPFHAWLQHPKFGNIRQKATREMDRGTLIHSLVLGKGQEDVVVIEAKDFRTKKAQEERDEAHASGKTPILVGDFHAAKNSADEIREAIADAGFHLMDGSAERVIVWTEETPFGPISCRGMLDWIHDSQPLIVDLKTCSCAHPVTLRTRVEDFGYHIQRAAYCSALRQLRPNDAGREDFAWVFLEELPSGSPKSVMLTVARPDGALRELGERQWLRACETWAKCLKENHWPGYESNVEIEASPWSLSREGMV